MKSNLVISLVTLFHFTASTRTPLVQWDPNTAKDCVEWYNNIDGESCEYVRKYYNITPEEFHEWNPSVSLSCEPWDWQSYCIVTQRRLDSIKPSRTSASVITTTTISASSLAPSPTGWESLGCYSQNPERSVLEQNLNPNGDGSLTIGKCMDSCYRRAFKFAGMYQGNQCWCSSNVAGEWTKNQTACNTPCSGDPSTVCGGQNAFNVFKALTNTAPAATSTISSSQANNAAVSAGVKAAASSNGAAVNRALFWMNF